LTKVAYVVKRYPRYSETFIVNEILELEKQGVEIEIFSLRPCCDTHFQDSISRVRAPVHYVPYAGVKAQDLWTELRSAVGSLCLEGAIRAAGNAAAGDFFQALTLAAAIRERGIEHMHAHFGSVATTVARIASVLTGVPYSFTAHAKDIFHESVDPADLRQKLADASAVVTVSEYNLQHLRETFGEAAARVVRVYNGLHLDRFPYAEPMRRSRSIVSVGRLVEKKGFDDLITACDLLREDGVDFTCDIVGNGELEQELRDQICRLGIETHVRLLGPRPQSQIIELVQSAAVFAAPCIVGDDGNRDGLPTVLLEAMALGTPCVSTDVTGIPEVIQDEQTGLMVRQRNPRELADAMRRLLDDSGLRVRLAQRARALIETDFDARQSAAQIAGLFSHTEAVAACG
jgi:colanic acid/amylovoran biosynthesis glycosyltransferase